MLKATFRPLAAKMNLPKGGYRKAGFHAAYGKTLDLLEYEIRKIGSSVVIEMDISAADVRNDGWVRSNVRPWTPGIALTFFGKDKRSYRFPCNTFASWQDNLRAIALALEALRTIDRYGVTAEHQQYTGFAQIEAPATIFSNEFEAAIYIASVICWQKDYVLSNRSAAIRMAMRFTHPDRPEGSHEEFIRVQAAAKALGQGQGYFRHAEIDL